MYSWLSLLPLNSEVYICMLFRSLTILLKNNFDYQVNVLLTNFEIVPLNEGAQQRKYCRKKKKHFWIGSLCNLLCDPGQPANPSEIISLTLNWGCCTGLAERALPGSITYVFSISVVFWLATNYFVWMGEVVSILFPSRWQGILFISPRFSQFHNTADLQPLFRGTYIICIANMEGHRMFLIS